MDQVIVKEFAKRYHGETSIEELRNNFNNYKQQWTDGMVEYLIKELMLSEESAK